MTTKSSMHLGLFVLGTGHHVAGWRVEGAEAGAENFALIERIALSAERAKFDLVFFADAMPPPVFEIGEFMSSTVEMTVHVRAVPAEGWLAMRVRTRYVIGGYHEEDAELWDSSGKLVAQSRQLALLGS